MAATEPTPGTTASQRPLDDAGYTVERITSLEEFYQLKESWDGLLYDTMRHKPYLEHDYFNLWLQYGDREGELSFCLVKYHGILEAIFPFVLKKQKHRGVPVRHLEFMGSIGAATRTPIFPQHSTASREAILQSLFRFLTQSVAWDTLRLNFIPTEDFPLETLERVLEVNRLKHSERHWFGTWYLDEIDVTGQQYLASRIGHIQKNVKRFARKFGQDGQMRLEIVTGGDDAAIERAVNQFHAVYRKSWKDWEAHPTFDLALARMARDKGYLRLGLLFVKEEPVAAQLWLVCNRKAYIAKIVYDEQFKRFSPGVTLTAAMATHVIDNDGANEIDFLFGDDTYKKDWTPKRRERKNILIFNRHSLRGWLLGYLMPQVGHVMRGNRILRPLREAVLRLLRID